MLPFFDVFDYFKNVTLFCDAPSVPIIPAVVPLTGVAPIIPPVTNPIQQIQQTAPIAPVAPAPVVEIIPQNKNVEPPSMVTAPISVIQVTDQTGAQPITSQDPTNASMSSFGNPQNVDNWASMQDADQFKTGGQVKQTGTSDKSHDKAVKAKRVGYRFTDKKAKKLGKASNAKPTAKEIADFANGKGVYFENRKNRSDKKRGKNL